MHKDCFETLSSVKSLDIIPRLNLFCLGDHHFKTTVPVLNGNLAKRKNKYFKLEMLIAKNIKWQVIS